MSEQKFSQIKLSRFACTVTLLGLILLPAACQSQADSPSLGGSPSANIALNTGSSSVETSSTPVATATSDISTVEQEHNVIYGQSTPLPSPTSVIPPTNLGPTALPSHFSPDCPAGSTYTPPPYTGPIATAPPIDPRYPTPLLGPHEVRHQHALPIEIRQSSFCGGTQTAHWYLDSTGVLSVSEAGQTSPIRRQLNSNQIAEILTLLDERQPHQWMFTEVYRCQAAEVCPKIHSVSVSTSAGGSTGWQERGNIAYPEIYQQTINSLLQKFTDFSLTAPQSKSLYTYRSAMLIGKRDANDQYLGTDYQLRRFGQLNGFVAPETSIDTVMAQAKQITNAQQQEFRELLQSIDPVTRYEQWHPRQIYPTPFPQVSGPETTWEFEMEAVAGNIDVNPTARLSSKYIPNTDEGRALLTDLARLSDLLKKWL